MPVGVTFGSVGDIISLSLLIKDLVGALDDCAGASAGYQEVIRELWALDRVLLEVELLSRTCEDSVELNALRITAHRLIDQCRQSMQTFLTKVQSYRKYLRAGGSGNSVKDAAKKVQWQMLHSNEVAKLRAEVAAHCSAINILLLTASVCVLTLSARLDLAADLTDFSNQTRLNGNKFDAQTTKNEVLFKNQESFMDVMRNQMNILNGASQQTMTATTKILTALKLDWLKKLGEEIRVSVRRIFFTNLATYKAVMDLRIRLPSHLERSLYQEPCILEDFIGRIAPVHTQFISSWEAFESVLEMRFRGVQGHQMVKDRQYVLQRRSDSRQIDQSRSWEGAFVPGQSVVMGMLFDTIESATSCPGCQTQTEEKTGSDIMCKGCGLCYKRVTELLEDEPLPSAAGDTWQLPKTKEQKRSQAFPIARNESANGMVQSRKRKADSISEEPKITDFKRVQLVHKQIRKISVSPHKRDWQVDKDQVDEKSHDTTKTSLQVLLDLAYLSKIRR